MQDFLIFFKHTASYWARTGRHAFIPRLAPCLLHFLPRSDMQAHRCFAPHLLLMIMVKYSIYKLYPYFFYPLQHILNNSSHPTEHNQWSIPLKYQSFPYMWKSPFVCKCQVDIVSTQLHAKYTTRVGFLVIYIINKFSIVTGYYC